MYSMWEFQVEVSSTRHYEQYSGGCLASLLVLCFRISCTWGGGWGAPPGSWSYLPSSAYWSVSSNHSTCGRTLGIRVRFRGIDLSTVGSSHLIPGVGVPSGWPVANSSRLQAPSHSCSGSVPLWTPRWDQLYTVT